MTKPILNGETMRSAKPYSLLAY